MISVIILTFNEARHIARAIESVRTIATEIFVIDSFSTDDTVEIARRANAIVVQHPFVNHSAQCRWAIETLPISTDWLMRLDADEVVEPDLAAEIAARLPRLEADVTGVNLKRKHIFWGRWIRHGGRYPLVLLRIWRRGRGQVEDRWMDEHIIVDGGRTVTLQGGFADDNLNDLTFFTDKHNKYATREAIDVLNQRYGLFSRDNTLSAGSASFQASVKREIKEKIYNRLPFWVGPFGYFLYRYFIQLGFLDGREGLVYHFLQGFWYRFLVGAKIEEYEQVLRNLDDNEARLVRLEALTGHRLRKPLVDS